MVDLVWNHVTVRVPDSEVDNYLARGFERPRKRATQSEPVAEVQKKRGRPKKS